MPFCPSLPFPAGSRNPKWKLQTAAKPEKKQDFWPMAGSMSGFIIGGTPNCHLCFKQLALKSGIFMYLSNIWSQLPTRLKKTIPKNQGSRGPKRSCKSKTKIRCCYCKCRRQIDVKNVGRDRQLPKGKANLDQCRAVRKQCKTFRFCSREHLLSCKAAESLGRGGRAPLTQNQCIVLIQTLMARCPWAAMLSLLQLFIVDRADCARRCCWSWLSGMQPDSKSPPTITIPKVNGKTMPRTIPIYQPFAAFLWKTSHGHPLQSLTGERWPAAGQDVELEHTPLFPGYAKNCKTRDWAKPISERAFLERLHQAADILQAQRAVAKAQGVHHEFQGFDLRLLGTHSFKKTSVSLMSEHQTSWAIISAISGTSVQMLQRCYDVPTRARQHQAMEKVFDPGVWGDVLSPSEAGVEPQGG